MDFPDDLKASFCLLVSKVRGGNLCSFIAVCNIFFIPCLLYSQGIPNEKRHALRERKREEERGRERERERERSLII
jgi:hypothetical protein